MFFLTILNIEPIRYRQSKYKVIFNEHFVQETTQINVEMCHIIARISKEYGFVYLCLYV